MARSVANKLYRTFVGGLKTEANELTYPENSTTSEDNCIIYRKGNRTRRLGFAIEPLGSPSLASVDDTKVFQEFLWKAVANNASLNFFVQQRGNTLYFYDTAALPLSGSLKAFTVNLNSFLTSAFDDTSTAPVQMASGKGFLFVVGERIEPFIVEYTPGIDSFSTQRVYIQIRDFKGLDDGLANDEEPSTLSKEHHYNLRNQGWVNAANDGTSGNSVQYFDSFGNSATYTAPDSTPINDYYTAITRYPANNKQWWAARDATTNDFDPDLLAKFYSGNNRAPRGHYVVDAFNIDRSGVSGVTGIPPEAKDERPVSVAFFGGRTFYLSGSTLYFSQVFDDKSKAGFCYQEADPTAEDISDLLPTDGGVIPIPEMSKGTKLMTLGDSMVIFANNGVWAVFGSNSGFNATDYTVVKVNPIGTDYVGSIVETEDQIYWWSSVGIMAMAVKMGQFGVVDGVFDKANISETTIQTFFNEVIPDSRKTFAKGCYDAATNTIQWLFSDSNTLPQYAYNRVLNLDLTLQAFYPWSLDVTSGHHLTGIFNMPYSLQIDHPQIRDSSFMFTYVEDTEQQAFGYFHSQDFADWGFAPYMSFAECGYELLEDAMRKKMTPWVFTYFRRTEEMYVPAGDDYTVDKPSSCFFQTKWDWASSQVSNKWSTKVQAYRHRRVPMFEDTDLTFDTGFPIVVTKHKVRGTGKAIQFRFESDEVGKDFDLLGWAVNFTGINVV